MFCPNCGNQIPEGAQFCGACGNRLQSSENRFATVERQQSPSAGNPQASTPNALRQFPPVEGNPYSRTRYTQPTFEASHAAGAAATSRGLSKRTVGVALGVIAVAVAIVAAGLLTSWFGLAKSEPVYVPTKVTRYFTDYGNGEAKASVTKYKYDENGNEIGYTRNSYEAHRSNGKLEGNEVSSTETRKMDVDENGFPEKHSSSTERADGTIYQKTSGKDDVSLEKAGRMASYLQTYETVHYDAEGKEIGKDSGESTIAYDHYANGRVKTTNLESDSRRIDSSLYIASGEIKYFRSEFEQTNEYDESGYLLRIATTGKTDYEDPDVEDRESESTSEYQWEFDSDGKPVSCTIVSEASYLDDEQEHEYTFDTDEFGNITTVYNEEGKLLAEYEYKKIDNPSPYVRNYRTKSFVTV